MKELYDQLVAAGDYSGDFNQFKKDYGGDEYENLYTQLVENEDYSSSFDDFKIDYEPVKMTTIETDAAVVEEPAPDLDSELDDISLDLPEITSDLYSTASPKKKFELLKEKYEPLGFTVQEDGQDSVNISNNKGQSQNFVVKPTEFYQSPTGNFSQGKSASLFEDIEIFTEENTPESDIYKTIYEATSQIPEDYATIQTSAESGPLTVSDITNLDEGTATADQQLNLVTTTQGLINNIYLDPGSIGLGNSGVGSAGFDNLQDEEYQEEIKDAVYLQLIEKTGLNINNADFDTIYNRVKSKTIQNSKDDLARQKKNNLISGEQASPEFVTALGDAYKRALPAKEQTLIDLNTKDYAALLQIIELETSLGNTDDPTEQAGLLKNIEDQNNIRKRIKEEIARNAQITQTMTGSGNVPITISQTDQMLASNVFGERGETEATRLRQMEAAESMGKYNVAQIKAVNPRLSDLEAAHQAFRNSATSINNIQSEAADQYVTIDVDNMGVNESLQGKFQAAGIFGKSKVSLYRLNQLGVSSKDLNNTLNFKPGSIERYKALDEKDLLSIRMYEEELKETNDQARAIYTLAYKQTAPEKISRAGFVKNIIQEGTVATLSSLGFSDEDAENAATLGTGPRNRLVKDRLQTASEAVGITWTDEQANSIERTFSEQISQGVGQFVPVIAELAALNLVTGGVLGATGALKVLTNLKSQGLYGKTLYHAAMAMIEEGKLQSVGFKPGGGLAFYGMGTAASGIKQPFGKAFNWFEPIFQKIVKAGPIGAASIEVAKGTELAYDALMGNKDFKIGFDEAFGDLDQVTKDMIINMFVFSISGAGHLKGGDFKTTQQKTAAVNSIEKRQQELVSGAEVIPTFGKKSRVKDVGGAVTEKETYDIEGKSVSKKVFDQYTALQEAKTGLIKQIYQEADFVKLDPKSKDFKSNFDKMLVSPINQAIKSIAPGYVPFTVKTGEGKSFTDGFKDKKAVAEFQVGKDGAPDVVLLDISRPDLVEKAMHEMSHAALKAYFSNPANTNQKRNFIKNLGGEVFAKEKLPGGITGEELGKQVDLTYSDKDFEIKQEEFLTNMIEKLADPLFYYTEVAPTLVSEIKLNIKDFFVDNGINAPQPKTAQQLVNALASVAFNAKRGTLSVNNAKTLAKLGSIDLLGIEYGEGKQDLSSQSSREISAKNKEIAEKNLKITEGKEILTQADKDALVEINMLKARELTNKAVRTGNNIGLEKEKQVRPEDWLSGYTERLIKLTNTYDPSLGVPFGAYMNKNLPLEYQSILKKYATDIETQTLEGREVESIVNEESSGFDTQDLSPGRKTVTEKKLLEPTEVLIKDLENQERELQLIENTIDKDLFVKKGEEKVFIDLTGKNIKNLKPSTKLIEEITQVFSKGGSIKFKDGKPLLKDGKTVSDQAGNVANQKEYIRERAEELFELINKAARMKPEGLSTATGIANSLLGPLFEKGARANVVDGTTAGLSKQKKLEWNPKTEKIFLEIFGAQENAPKLPTSSKKYKNQVTKINALIREIAKVSLNRRARVLGKERGASIETLQRLADGKSESAASRPLFNDLKNIVEKSKGPEIDREKLISTLVNYKGVSEKEKQKILDVINNLPNQNKRLVEYEKLTLEEISDIENISNYEALTKYLRTEKNYKSLRKYLSIKEGGIKRIISIENQERLKKGYIALVKNLIPKGKNFKDLPKNVQQDILSTVGFGDTRGKLGEQALTFKERNLKKGDYEGLLKEIDPTGEILIGTGKKYTNNLEAFKYISDWGAKGFRGKVLKIINENKSNTDKIKSEVEKLLTKEPTLDKDGKTKKVFTFDESQAINVEILRRAYESLADMYVKNPTKENLSTIADILQIQVNRANGIFKGNVPMRSITLVPEKGSTKGKFSDKELHNEHFVELFSQNKNFLKNLDLYGKGELTINQLNDRIKNSVSLLEQGVISEKLRGEKDSGGNSVGEFLNKLTFLGNNAKNQLLLGSFRGNSLDMAEFISKDLTKKQIDKVLNTNKNLNVEGITLKQVVENIKEFKKVKVENERIAKKAGIDTKDLSNTEILEKLKEKDKTNQEELIESYASRDLDLAFNEIIEAKTGISKEKTYSKAKAAVVGAKAGKVKLIASSAQDFEGLMYRTLGKGKVGDTQKKFYEEFLYRPLAQAEANLATDRVTMANNFKALKKQLKVSPKDLRKNIEKGEPWSKEQAVRVHIWNKQGMTVPDLSKADLKLLDKFVKSDPKLEAYAQELILLGKGTPYAEPGKNWEVGTITSDLIKSIQTTKRSEYLAPFISNADIMFNEKNLNKLEAGFGIKYREALENSLARIKAGKNRLFFNSDSGSALENRVLDYINNSTGAIMFFNTRSAVLQTISAANFLNFKENNPLAAGIAFANQPQYWKDFSKLMNSDYLVDRRQGVKLNVAEAEIADAVHDQTNKPKAALNYILRKGFLPTQFADSFAIASGGATYYRNRIKMYEKEGLTTVEAEKKAYLDFMDTAEKSQQSSKAQRISMQQASNLGRVVLAFANTPSQYLRLTQKATSDLLNNRGSKTENISKIAYYSLVQNLLFTTLQHATVGLLFDEEEDDKAQAKEKIPNVLSSMFDNLARGAGVAGAGVVTAKAIAMKIHEESKKKRSNYSDVAYELLTFSPPIRSKVLKLRSAGRTYDWNKKEIKEMGWDLKNPAYLAGANVVSAFTNIPLDRVVKKANNLRGAMDEQNALWQRIALSMGWNRYELGLPYETYKTEKQPFSNKIDIRKIGTKKIGTRKIMVQKSINN